jgi:hypothetical protein
MSELKPKDHAEAGALFRSEIIGALTRRELYLDNGSTYRGDTLRLAWGRLGITLMHARPCDPHARGKPE